MKNAKQVLSITLSSALMLTSAPWPAAAAGPVSASPAFAQVFAPAESLGYIASSYAPATGATRPRLIVIADLHSHVEVQHHIVDMLDTLVNKLTTGSESQKQVPIFVEGGWQPHLEHPLSSVKNPKIRSIMAEYFLQKGEIPASQAFSERYPNATNFTLTGVEDKDEYTANRDRFLKTYPVRKRLLEAIARHEDALKELTGNVEARSFQKIQDMRRAYQTGSLPGDRYARALLHQADRFNITGHFVEVLRQPNAASSPEFDLALTEVNRKVSEKLSENRPLAAYFRGDEKMLRANLSTVDAYLDILKRTLGDQLTPEEVPYAYARVPQMAQVAKVLLADDKLDIDIPHALIEALSFYPFAFMRNDTLVGNSLAELKKGSPNDTGILVAGGFHTEAISQYLKSQQIPFILINPVVSRDLSIGEELNFVKRMAGEPITATEAQADFRNGIEGLNAGAAGGSVSAYTDNPKATTVGGSEPSVRAVEPAIEATPAVEKELGVEPKTDKGTQDQGPAGPGKNSGFASAGDNFGAQYEAAAKLGVVVRTADLVLDPALEGTRADEAKKIMEANEAPIGGTLSKEGATFTFDGKSYSGQGEMQGAFADALAFTMQSIPETDRAAQLPTTIHIVGVHGMHAKFGVGTNGVAATNVENPEAPHMYASGINTDKVVILVNLDKLAEMEKTAKAHEFAHAVTGLGFEHENKVQIYGIMGYLRGEAAKATKAGVQDAASVGVTATTIATEFAIKKLKALGRNELDLSRKERRQLFNQIRNLGDNGVISFEALQGVLVSALKPAASTVAAQKQVAVEKAKWEQQFPELSELQVETQMEAENTMLNAAFPERRRNRLQNIFANLSRATAAVRKMA